MKNYEKPSINKVDFAMASKYGSPLKSQKIRKEIIEAGQDVRKPDFGRK